MLLKNAAEAEIVLLNKPSAEADGNGMSQNTIEGIILKNTAKAENTFA